MECKKRLECKEFCKGHKWCEDTGNYDCLVPTEATESRAPSGQVDLLVSCPICDGKATTVDAGDSWYVECYTEGCLEGCFADNEKDAISRWNKRAI